MALSEAIQEIIPLRSRPKEERLPSLDLLRGIAILFILPANIPIFSGAINVWSMQPVNESTADRAVMSLTLFLVYGKFITLLSILFGAGLALQSDRAEAEGRPFAWYYVGRMLLLFAIGLVHGLFLWFGDILTSYAVVGLIALLLSRLPSKGLLAVAGGCLAIMAGWVVIIAALMIFAAQSGSGATGFPSTGPSSGTSGLLDFITWYMRPENQSAIWKAGGIGGMILARALFLLVYSVQFLLMYIWYILACFLIGIYLARRGIFHHPAENRGFLAILIVAGLAVGVPLQLAAVLLYLLRPEWQLHALLPYSLGGLPMSLAYLGLTLFATELPAVIRFSWPLQAVGKTALSNYLLQSLLCNLIYYSCGLRLYGDLGHTANLLVVIAIWLLQIGLSMLWLLFFQIGPVEWLWRSLADGKARPLLRPLAPEWGVPRPTHP